MRAFAVDQPGKTLDELVAKLGGNFAPIQIVIAMGNEAVNNGWTGWFARDLFPREIHLICPEGWSSPRTQRFDRAHAVAAWLSMLNQFRIGNPDAILAAAQHLVDDPPPGWDPRGPDDRVLAELLAGLV